MNYKRLEIEIMIPELFAMLKAAESEIQKEHQVLMVNKTTSFKKNGMGKKGNSKEEWQSSCPSCEETQGWTQARN